MKKWYSSGLDFSCTGCGSCCAGAPGYVWLEEGEADEIAGFLNMSVTDFYEEHTRYVHGDYSLKEKRNGDCEFLDHNPVRCSIYEVRPVQCSSFPFWESIMQSRELWDLHSRKCPGMDQGDHHTEEDIDRILDT